MLLFCRFLDSKANLYIDYNKDMKKKIFLILVLALFFSVYFIEEEYGPIALVIEEVTDKTPKAKIEKYIYAVSAGDREQALIFWTPRSPSGDALGEYGGDYELIAQRETITQDLIAKRIDRNFKIKNIEWWSTCCVPRVIDDSREAGLAKVFVELTDSNNIKSDYIFVLSVPGGYEGDLVGHSVRNWEINSVILEK